MSKQTQTNPMEAIAKAVTTEAAPKADKAVSVALRGGPAITHVKLSGANYRTTAAHNVEWWKAVTEACKAGPAEVSKLLLTKDNPKGVPGHFIGYTLRKGYLTAVTK